MWRMLQQDAPRDYVIGTGETHSVRDLCEVAFGTWDSTGGYVKVDRSSCGPPKSISCSPTRAGAARPGVGAARQFEALVKMMVDADLSV